MNAPLNNDEIIKELEKLEGISNTYLLVHEFKCYLQVSDNNYKPTIDVKVYAQKELGITSYYATLSHYAKTPQQAEPYVSDSLKGYTVMDALAYAIKSVRNPIQEAIHASEQPDDSWLVPNKRF